MANRMSDAKLDAELETIEAAIRRHPDGLTARQLGSRLEGNLPHRTLQYRLKLLVTRGRLVREGAGRQTRYRAASQKWVRKLVFGDRLALDDSIEIPLPLSERSIRIRDYVRRPLAARTPVGYRREFLDSYEPNVSFHLSPLATTAAIEDPFEQSFFFMVQLPCLQPFEDVNKRVSRLGAKHPLHQAQPVAALLRRRSALRLHPSRAGGVRAQSYRPPQGRIPLGLRAFCRPLRRRPATGRRARPLPGSASRYPSRACRQRRTRGHGREDRDGVHRRVGFRRTSSRPKATDSATRRKAIFSPFTKATTRAIGSALPSSRRGDELGRERRRRRRNAFV